MCIRDRLNTCYKVYSKLHNQRFKATYNALLLDGHSSFRISRSCSDNIFLIKQIVENGPATNVDIQVEFIYYENRTVEYFDMQKISILLCLRHIEPV